MISKISTNKYRIDCKERKQLAEYLLDTFEGSSYKEDSVFLYVDSITNLSHSLLNYNSSLFMIYYLKKQQEFLEKNGYSFYYFSIDDVIIINKCIFVSIGPDMKMDEKKYLHFYRPYMRNLNMDTCFFSPELEKKILPAHVSCKTVYYSLGAIVVSCLFKEQYSKEKEILNPIMHSKLYWFLLRCLRENPDERYLIYV